MDRGRRADRDDGRRTPGPARAGRGLALLAGAALPIVAYLVLRRVLHSDGYALAVSALISLAAILTRGHARRRFGLVAVLATAVLVIAVVVSLASGGSALPLKLRRAAITGPLGIACLVSVAVRRPLLPTLLSLLPSVRPAASRIDSWRAALTGSAASALTAIVGLTLLTDAIVQVMLSFVVSTTTFVAVTGLARLAVAAVGLLACAWYMRMTRPVPGSQRP